MNDKLYKGLSFRNFTKNKKIKVYDKDLIRADIINHIHTLRLEKRKHPTFGTIAGELKYEPMVERYREALRADIEEVLNYDPRISLIDLKIQEDFNNKQYIVEAEVRYLELGFNGRLHLNIETGE